MESTNFGSTNVLVVFFWVIFVTSMAVLAVLFVKFSTSSIDSKQGRFPIPFAGKLGY